MSRWNPAFTAYEARPEPGRLVARAHAVWRVTAVTDLPLNDADRQVWLDHRMPDPATWRARPYRVDVEWVGGKEPSWFAAGNKNLTGRKDVRAGEYVTWHTYAGERWPQCSCCGEPMPCRAELEDRQVAASLTKIARMEAVPPGACWACGEVVTTRQKTVTYPGDNVDLPGGPQPRFHLRASCVHSAHDYEERWLAVDPRRERILTYPQCGGTLIVHGDGSSECVAAPHPLGADQPLHPDCRGHDTHDHGVITACTAREAGQCPRGCTREGHPGTRCRPRPDRALPGQTTVGES